MANVITIGKVKRYITFFDVEAFFFLFLRPMDSYYPLKVKKVLFLCMGT
jgi:hypothetical protein